MRLFLALFFAFPLTASAQSTPWQAEQSGTTADLRGIHAVGGGVAWASGTDGTVLRTEDAGYMWQSCAMPPGAEKLDFRAIWAWDANTAIVMSSGPGAQSRLYKTTDGCDHWTLLYTNPDKDGFWDALIFQNQQKGYLLGDPVGGRFVVLTTQNGGSDWTRSDAAELAIEGNAKGAFAASNTALLAGLREPVLFGTSGGFTYAQSYVGHFDVKVAGPLKMTEHWRRFQTPVGNGTDTAGIFSLGYRSRDNSGYGYTLLAVGGDYLKPEERAGAAASTTDGQHWIAASALPGGYRSAVAWDEDGKRWITVGPNGSDSSRDDGRTWQPLEHAPANTPKGGEWNALSLPWAVGPHGRIAKLNPDVAETAGKKTVPVPR